LVFCIYQVELFRRVLRIELQKIALGQFTGIYHLPGTFHLLSGDLHLTLRNCYQLLVEHNGQVGCSNVEGDFVFNAFDILVAGQQGQFVLVNGILHLKSVEQICIGA